MILSIFVLGLVVLTAGAELLVRGASKLALSLGVSPLVVGLTIVSMGTSAPEMSVSVQSAASGQADLALGNVVGSNILNVLFILGASALVQPLVVAWQLIRQEVPLMIGVSVLLLLLALDGGIGRGDGALLVLLLAVYSTFLIRQSRRAAKAIGDEFAEEFDLTSNWDRHWAVQVILIVAGLAMLVQGSRWMVQAAVGFARSVGISELVVGLTVVAAGTSLPEIATSIMAAFRGQRDIAVGNVVGSNTFNILGVAGLSALASPTGLPVSPSLLWNDLPVMILVAVACLPIFFTGRTISRWEGGVLLAFYVAYTAHLVMAAQGNEALVNFRIAMGLFVLPLTLLTLAVLAIRQVRGRRF
jgi:cation:H+ antiporter